MAIADLVLNSRALNFSTAWLMTAREICDPKSWSLVSWTTLAKIFSNMRWFSEAVGA